MWKMDATETATQTFACTGFVLLSKEITKGCARTRWGFKSLLPKVLKHSELSFICFFQNPGSV